MLWLPIELVDHIIDFLDDCSDILSLALTCRLLAKRLIPSVLEYREITTTINLEALWSHLADSPSLARNIRALHIEPTLGWLTRLPREFRQEETFEEPNLVLDSWGVVTRALEHMSGLTSFHWSWTDELVDRRGIGPLLDIVFTSCPRLVSLELREEMVQDFNYTESLVGDQNSKFSTLRNIQSFRCDLWCMYSDMNPTVPIPAVIDFMSNNSHLRIVDLQFRELRLSQYDLLAQIHLPHLHTFKISTLEFSSTILLAFLKRNRTLEALDVCVDFAPDTPTGEVLEGLEEGSLPNLHSYTALTTRGWICVCRAKPPLRVLEYIGVEEFHETDHHHEQTGALLVMADTLEIVVANHGELYHDEVARIKKWFLLNLPHVQLRTMYGRS